MLQFTSTILCSAFKALFSLFPAKVMLLTHKCLSTLLSLFHTDAIFVSCDEYIILLSFIRPFATFLVKQCIEYRRERNMRRNTSLSYFLNNSEVT